MKKSALLFLLFTACGLLYADLPQLYSTRLDKSLDYQRALLQLEQARLLLRQQEAIYIPYVDIGGGLSQSGGRQLTLENGLLQPFSFVLRARFLNVLGADFSLTLPFTWDAEAGAAVEVPTLSVSRQLFTETAADLLKARAAVMKQEQNIENVRMSVWADLVKDICDYAYYLEAKEIQGTYADTLEKKIAAARDEQTVRTLKKQWYGMRRNVLEAESALNGLSLSGQGLSAAEIPAVYRELMDYTKDIEKKLPDPKGMTAADRTIQALKLSLNAAEKQAGFWFLPFLPNPVFSAGITYDIEKQAVDWSVSLGFSISVFDRGERAVEAASRKKGADLARLELEQAEQSKTISLDRGWSQKEILKMDYEIAGLNLEEKTELRDEAEQLFKQGFISEEDYIMNQMDFRMAGLAQTKSANQYLIQLLDIVRMYGAGGAPKEN